MGVSALLAIRQAIAAAKKDLGEDPKTWFNLRKFWSFFLGHFFFKFWSFFLLSGSFFKFWSFFPISGSFFESFCHS
jgi:hypothetical protein